MEFYQKKNTSFVSAIYYPHEDQYKQVLKLVKKKDVIIDMGSGDFRFPLMLSQKVKKVYAIELNPELVHNALKIINYHLPKNLIIICGDWVNISIPKDVTIITCLCNGAIIPEEWYKYKIIFGLTSGIKIIEKKEVLEAKALRSNTHM